jgi:galactose mutarotase-like enzyme
MSVLLDTISLRVTGLTARISLRGAEIKSLITNGGTELIWCGDSIWWEYSSPFLFPVIGALEANKGRWGNETFSMASHGFARTSRFELLSLENDRATLALYSNGLTRQQYPFDFVMHVEHRLQNKTLQTTVTIINSGKESLPASFGFHPAISWPMSKQPSKVHRLVFEADEPAKVQVVNRNGQLESTTAGLPILNKELMLTHSLFAKGALVINPVQSHKIILADDLGELITLSWIGCDQLGLWTKPGAPFICIEPWVGYPSPLGWAGNLEEKPGSFRLDPGASRCFSMDIDCSFLLERNSL